MNIQEAKQEIIHTVQAYEAKDETGAYLIPVEKQRPMLLIGPPGIGKTAIMTQVAQELGINLVAYTMTHHTRQSAIGLPMISKRAFGGKEYAVTEYTMSEIVAAVYEQIEKSGIREGILFLDEINCISETLAPAMLQFLQYKTFGAHRIPDGFVVVTAGNPPQYNKSVRDFDIVTLDRVRRLQITEDLPIWKTYARAAGVHGAILAYLEIHKQNFYVIRKDVEEQYFVTARGWEDLSRMLRTSEALGLPVTQDLIREYLQDPEIAADFATYYELYNKYENIYQIPSILEGNYPAETEKFHNAPFDEKLSLIGLLLDRMNGEFRDYAEELDVQKGIMAALGQFRDALRGEQQKGTAAELLGGIRGSLEAQLQQQMEAKLLGQEQIRTQRLILTALQEAGRKLSLSRTGDPATDFGIVRQWFDDRENARQERITACGAHLTHCFEFLARVYGEGQEMVVFLSELSDSASALQFIQDCGNEAYYRYNKLLLLRDRQSELREEVLRLKES